MGGGSCMSRVVKGGTTRPQQRYFNGGGIVKSRNEFSTLAASAVGHTIRKSVAMPEPPRPKAPVEPLIAGEEVLPTARGG